MCSGVYTHLHRHVRSFLSIRAATLYVCDMNLSQKTEMPPENLPKSSVFSIMFAAMMESIKPNTDILQNN